MAEGKYKVRKALLDCITSGWRVEIELVSTSEMNGHTGGSHMCASALIIEGWQGGGVSSDAAGG